MSGKRPQYRLGVDVGGTHTDLVLLDSATGQLLVEKVASTPKNPALGVLAGVARFVARGIDPREYRVFRTWHDDYHQCAARRCEAPKSVS